MDSNQEKPVLVIKRTRIFGSVFNAFIGFLTIFISIFLLLSGEVRLAIFGGMLLLLAFFAYILPLMLQSFIFYDNFFIAKYKFWSQTIKYTEVKYLWYYKYFTNKFFFIRLKFGVKFLECLGSIIIDIYSFDKCDLKKVINIFQNKNLYKEFWYTGNLNEI